MTTDDPQASPDRLNLIVFSGTYERVHYALVLASGAQASERPATLFFTMGAARALVADAGDGRPGWHALPTEDGRPAAVLDARFAQRGVAGFEDLLAGCLSLGVTTMVCEMGLQALNIAPESLRGDIPLKAGGVITFLNDASRHGGMMFL
mgnify:CR=1 FL=1